MSDTIKRPSITRDGVENHFRGIVAKDFFLAMTGDWLGGGIGRGVYVLGTDPSLVVKIETASHSFQNVAEWEVWNQLEASDRKAM